MPFILLEAGTSMLQVTAHKHSLVFLNLGRLQSVLDFLRKSFGSLLLDGIQLVND